MVPPLSPENKTHAQLATYANSHFQAQASSSYHRAHNYQLKKTSREHNSAGFLHPGVVGPPHSPSGQACWEYRGRQGSFSVGVCTGRPRPAERQQTTNNPKGAVTATETSELTFSNQLDKFFDKPIQGSASRKSFWTDSALPICKSHVVLRTSLKDVAANFNIMIKTLYYAWTRALQTAWLSHHM